MLLSFGVSRSRVIESSSKALSCLGSLHCFKRLPFRVQGWRLDLVWSGLDFVENLKSIGISRQRLVCEFASISLHGSLWTALNLYKMHHLFLFVLYYNTFFILFTTYVNASHGELS